MNSTVEPIFNKKVAEQWNLWVREQCMVCTNWLKIVWQVKLCGYCSLNSSRNIKFVVLFISAWRFSAFSCCHCSWVPRPSKIKTQTQKFSVNTQSKHNLRVCVYPRNLCPLSSLFPSLKMNQNGKWLSNNLTCAKS